MFRPLVLLLALASLASTVPFDAKLIFPHLFSPIHYGVSSSSAISSRADVTESFVTQPVDHFGSASSVTFQQRYFCNTKYANNSGIYLLYVESFGTAYPGRVSDDSWPHVQSAKGLGAAVCSLEHRGYGKSPLAKTNSFDDMAQLTSEQAVEDISTFIAAINKANGEKTPKWVLIGQSYGGSLALWHRQLHPELTVGVVSSAAPINPAADFYKFQRNVEDVYRAADPQCYANFASGMAQVRQAMQNTKGRKRLSQELALQPAFAKLKLNYNDIQHFYHLLAGFHAMPVINNNINYGVWASAGGIADVCKVLNSASTASDGVGRIIASTQYIVSTATGAPYAGLPNSYDAVVDYLSHEDSSDGRLMMYQLASEFGWFPTTDYANYGAFGSQIPNNLFLDFISDVFGKHARNATTLRLSVNVTHNYYHTEYVYTGSNALIVQGTWDPWKSLGANATSDPTSSVCLVDGGASASDRYPPRDSDSDSLKACRKSVRRFLGRVTGRNSGNSARLDAAKTKALANKQREIRDNLQSTTFLPKVEQQIKNWNAKITWNVKHPHHKKPQQHSSVSHSPLINPLRHRSTARQMNERARRHLAKLSMGVIQGLEMKIGTHTIDQDIDHFDSSVSGTYQQYFMTNDDYYKKNGPHFLMLGGEAPMESWLLMDGLTAMMDWANNYGAMAYALEHRFYGVSQPFDDVSTEHLHWLSSQQALADAAVFIKAVNKEKNLKNPTWIVFGGSYPGNLAAWFRLKYPDLVKGAIASSAPVQARTDLWQYLLVVENSTVTYGGRQCAQNVHTFFSWAQQQFTTNEGRKQIAIDFGICDKWDGDWVDEKDAELLLADFIFFVAGDVQYDDEKHDYVSFICEIFAYIDEEVDVDVAKSARAIVRAIGKGDLREKYLRNGHKLKREDIFGAGKGTSKKDSNAAPTPTPTAGSSDSDSSNSYFDTSSDYYDVNEFCDENNYKKIIDIYRHVTPVDTSDRCWLWQTCNELGVFQSTNFGHNIFEASLPVNFYVDMCTDIFGPQYTREAIDANVRKTNADYGGQYGYNGTNVVFANGSEDPWHVLSVYWPINANVTSILIDGTSHCYDMWADAFIDVIEGETKALKAAKKQMKAILGEWVGAKKKGRKG